METLAAIGNTLVLLWAASFVATALVYLFIVVIPFFRKFNK